MNREIELEIGAGPGTGNYVVRVIRAATGGAPSGSFNLDVEEILARRSLLEATVLASATTRRSVPAAEQPVREVGRLLFEALFAGPVYGMYRASLGVAQQHGRRLRVLLRLAAPELAALPWEMLFDPETGTYLCRQEPLVRHVPAPYTPDPLEVSLPLRILGLVASPRGFPPLDVNAEIEYLEQALAGPIADGLIEVVWVPQATWAEVHARLLAAEWHVLHFVGHGDYDAAADEGVIALVGADGRADLVEAGRLADLLGEAQPAPRLVVLNSCSSGKSGVQDLFSGTAAALARSGISSVAAMQFSISDTAAIAFARGFYTAIVNGRDVDEAARSGRISILGMPHSLEWVTPVLYLRGQATKLFSLTAQVAAAGYRASAADEGLALQREEGSPVSVTGAAAWQQGQPKGGGQWRDGKELRLAVERRMAEAQFRTDAVRDQIAALDRLLMDRNRTMASRRRRVEAIFNSHGPEAFVSVLQESLATSVYPYGMQGSCAAVYLHDARKLLIEYEFPQRDIIPSVEAYRYVKTMGLVQPQPRQEAEIRRLYGRLIASITLRTLAEAFDIASEGLVTEIVFNGYVSAKDPISGKAIRPLLVSISATRNLFDEIVLDEPELDPEACMRGYLDAIVSPRPYDLEAISPIAEFDLSKYKFVEEMDVVAGLGRQADLLKLKPIEFEHLIRQLLEAMGIRSWVTQASTDEGVDVVAVNEDPIVGGLCIIQVKRYSKRVGLEAIHALAGVVADRNAAKGVLITTSWVGKASRDFAARNGRIEIIEGRQLKYLLKQHLGIDVLVSLPKPLSD